MEAVDVGAEAAGGACADVEPSIDAVAAVWAMMDVASKRVRISHERTSMIQ